MKLLKGRSLTQKHNFYRKVFVFLILSLILVNQVFAQQGPGEIASLDKWARVIVGMFTSTWLKAVCIIALIAIALGMVTVGRQEPGMFKKFVPWLVGVIILLSATQIVNFFFADSSGLTDGL